VGSASKNARVILEATGFLPLFDAIADGTRVQKAKPDPEVFLLAASDLGVEPAHCVVFETRFPASRRAQWGMYAVGVGTRENLPNADAGGAGSFRFLAGRVF
jgi:beta-phosphoglucomutase